MSPAVAAGLIVVVILVCGFLVFTYFVHRSENGGRGEAGRKELKAARAELVTLRKALRQVEDLAWANPDGFVLNHQLIDIVRTTRNELEG